MIDLKRLRQAMVLAETGSFSRAAEALNMSQPSLSQSIRELERRLGAAVFERTARAVTPTAFGLALLNEGADLVARAEALERDLRRRQGLETGRLAVGFGVYGYRPTIPAVAAAFAAAHPGVALRLMACGWRQAEDALAARTIDLFVGEPIASPSADLYEQRGLQPRAGRVVVRPHHPLTALSAPSLDEIGRYPLAGPRLPARIFGHFPEGAALGRLDHASAQFVPHFESDSWAVVTGLLLHTDAVAFAHPSMLAGAAADLRPLAFDRPWMHSMPALVWRRDRPLSPEAAAFLTLAERTDAAISP